MSASPLRVGVMPYLLGRPLVRGLAQGNAPDVEMVWDTPAAIGDALLDDQLDAALAPMAMVVQHPDIEVIPGLGVGCDGPVASIKLFHRKPLGELQTVALDSSSRSAALLAQIILKRFEGADPQFVPSQPDLSAMLAGSDAALLIGDNALDPGCGSEDIPFVDLGEKWKQLTGLGFVFAMWAMRPGLEREKQRRLAEILYASLARGEAELEEIVEAETDRSGISAETVRTYLTRNITYRLAEVHLAGLARFVTEARDLKLLSPEADVPGGAKRW